MIHARTLATFPRLRRTWPIFALADLTGLAVALLVATPWLRFDGADLFLVLLAGVAFICWSVTAQLSRAPKLFQRGYRLVTVPALATVLTLALVALMRVPYSNAALLVFLLAWTAWIAASRLALRRIAPPVQILCLGAHELCERYRGHRKFQIRHPSTPPADFGRWDAVVVDGDALASPEWFSWLTHAELAGVTILSFGKAHEVLGGRVPSDVLDRRWVADLLAQRPAYAFWKRLFDVAVVLLLSPVIALACALVALVVFCDGGRPILFWQERAGLGGRTFRMVKFRSMRPDAEKAGARFASSGDARITRTGALLRKFRLDELPQFWNVLRGDMSIIGPRPEQATFAREFVDGIPLYELRHSVRPGITGWAQVMQGYAAGEDETREKLSFDLYYIKHCCLQTDVLVVLKTIRTVLTGFGSR